MKLKHSIDRHVQLACLSAVAILLLVVAVSFRTLAISSERDRWVQHTYQVSENLESILMALAGLEAGSNAFVLTGNESFLDSWRTERSTLTQRQSAMRTLSEVDPAQHAELPLFDLLITQQINFIEAINALRRTAGADAAVDAIRDGTGLRIDNDIRQLVGRMQAAEQAALTQHLADASRRLYQNKLVMSFGTALGLIVASIAGFGVMRSSARRRAAEAALRVREDQYRSLLDEVRDYAIFMLDRDGQVVTWNAGAERIIGYDSKQIIGNNFTRFFTRDDINSGRPPEILRITALSGRHEEQSMRVRQDGSQFVAGSTYTALYDPNGDLRGFSQIIRDLSETKESGAKYRGLMEAAPDAMVVVNQSGEIVLLNLQAEKQFGYRRDELLGQNVSAIVPEGFAERLVADGLRSAEDALAQQIGTGIELMARRRDGSEFPIELMLSPLRSTEGILVTAAIRNISVRKDAERHLAQMESRYRGLLEAAPDAMVVVNQAGKIVLLNLQAEKQFGYRRDELLGQKVSNIVPTGFSERLEADSLRSAEDALAQQIGTGIELTARRKDGSEFPIEIMLSPLRSTEGILITAAIRDISVRKEADTVLAHMESRYRGLLEAAPDAMIVVNQAEEIVLLNLQAEKQFGYRRDELLGQRVTNLVPEGFGERLVADRLRSAEDALAQQIDTGIELTAKRKDGSEFPIEIMLSPLESVDGVLVTAAIRDITARKRGEAQLLEKVVELNRSNEELQQFAYIASHDLQEPLRMVASYTALLSRRYKGKLDSDADDFIAFAVDGAARMQQLIQDLLAYSRVGLRGQELALTSSDDALRAATRNLRGAIEESGAIVTHGELPVVVADEMQLTQLFQNLVGNAIKYRRNVGSSVHVSAEQSLGKPWIFSVTDNGLGIEAQYFDRIFGMFQRLHKREEYAGTGIGLAICKKIVERHGGKISVESTIGRGSTFRFSLPSREARA